MPVFVLSPRLVTAPAEIRRIMPPALPARTVHVSPKGSSMLVWPAKDPDEVLDYDVDWTWRLFNESELLQAQAQRDALQSVTVIPADTIATSQFTLPVGVVANSSTHSDTATKVWISGGDGGVSYEILNRITTAGGRTMDLTVKLKIRSK